MIQYDNICIAIVSGLSDYLGIRVIEMNPGGKIPPYPFATYEFTDPGDTEDGFPVVIRTGDQIKHMETVEFTVSFHIYSESKAECIEYALKARDWFRGPGHQALKDAVNVVIIDVGSVDNRDLQIGNEWERRNGFEVDFRTVNTIEFPIETIDRATIKQRS